MKKHLYHMPNSGDVYVATSLAEAQEHARYDLKTRIDDPAGIDADVMDMRQIPDDSTFVIKKQALGLSLLIDDVETASGIAEACDFVGALTNIYYV